ncbi:MAG: RNase H family protein [Anaerolineae bacterium]
MNPIIIHTDGSCETQTRLGGWAAVLQCGEHQRVLQGSASDTTVNAMELTAVIEALKALKQAGSSVQLFSDSNYVVRGVNEVAIRLVETRLEERTRRTGRQS